MKMTIQSMGPYYEAYEAAKASNVPPGKGEFLGECNRTACKVAPAISFNRVTRACYCVGCARKINESWQASIACQPDPQREPLCAVLQLPVDA